MYEIECSVLAPELRNVMAAGGRREPNYTLSTGRDFWIK